MAGNLLGVVYGIAFGIANVIPGLSGGTMLVIFGCYDKVCGALSLDFKEIKKNFKFLCFFGIGAIVGILGFAKLFEFLIKPGNVPVPTFMFLLGLVLGGLPLIISLMKTTEDNRTVKIKPICVIPFLLGLGLVVGLAVMAQVNPTPTDQAESANPVLIAVYGMIAAVAMVIPGVSGSFMLLAFGVYDLILGSVNERDLSILIPAAIGILIGLVVGARLIMLLLKKFRMTVYAVITGMVIGSVVPLYLEGFGAKVPEFNLHLIIGFICFIGGFVLSTVLGKDDTKEV